MSYVFPKNEFFKYAKDHGWDCMSRDNCLNCHCPFYNLAPCCQTGGNLEEVKEYIKREYKLYKLEKLEKITINNSET